MALQVSLIKAPGDLLGSKPNPSVHTFDERGGTLGRSSSNTWALPDPDRFLSSCHCEIVCDKDQFYLVDLSTNGTFVNGSPEPLGKGMRKLLAHGDTFEIGDYQFSVSLVAEEGNNSSLSIDPSDPFGSTPFGDLPQTYSQPFTSELFSTADDLLSLSPMEDSADPLAALDRAREPITDQDPFSLTQSGSHRDPFVGAGSIDPTPSLDEALSWPNTMQQDIIPDDWEDDLLSGRPPISHAIEYSNSPPHEVNLARAESTRSEVHPDIPEPAQSAVKPLVAEKAVDIAQRPVRESKSQAVPEGAASGSGYGTADVDFIAALGFDPDNLSEEDRKAISQIGGQMLREVVAGLMQLLRSRSTIKNEFRMNVTTIEPFENNPFKFSVGVDEALENIFLKKGKAYKEPLDALQESFQELGEHQLAMIAGVRVGFERMMERFEPQLLAKIFKRRGKYSSIPGVREARCWTNYCDYYAGFSDNMDSSFQSLFGTDFVQAYEEHLRKLSATRKVPKGIAKDRERLG